MNIDTMRLLVAKGLSAEDILEIAESMAAPAKRSAAAERQARYRARQKADGVTESVTRDVTRDDNGDVSPALSRPPNENNSNPPTHTHPDKNTRARKGHRLPVDWEPETLTGDAAEAVACWPPGAVERELSRFRDWAASATGPNAVKSNWQAAWRNWIRKAEDDGRYGRKPQQSARPSLVDIGRAVAADLEREAQARASF